MKKPSSLRLAVIGVGNMGRHHARVFSGMEGVHLVAVVDKDRKRGEQVALQYKCGYYRDYGALLKKEPLDAATIAVPTSLHTKVALRCLAHNVPVLIEKPIAPTLQSAKSIIRYSKKKRLPVCIGHIERFNPVVQRLKKLIDAGRFGKIISISTKRVGVYPPQITDVDVIIDLAVHDIDVCNYLLGRQPKRVYARAGKAMNSRQLDYADIFLSYADTDVILQVNWITPVKVRELAVTGIKAFAHLNYMDQTLNVYNKGHGEEDDIVNIEAIHIRKEEPLKRELKNFIQYITTKKGDIVAAEEGYQVLKVAQSAVASCKKKHLIVIK
jgi:UDP-N-acetylglucosamine 3-dehydrogenase